MRTKANIHTLTGHTNTVESVLTQAAEPQVITGSHDSTIRLWDLASGKSIATLTNHKKSVRFALLLLLWDVQECLSTLGSSLGNAPGFVHVCFGVNG